MKGQTVKRCLFYIKIQDHRANKAMTAIVNDIENPFGKGMNPIK